MSNMDKGVRYYPSRYGMLAHFEADKHIGRSLERYGEWAQSEIVTLIEYIPDGGVVIDIGAHIGTHTLPFARKVGKSGSVIAIEGQPEVATLLSASIVANELYDRVTVLNAVAGNRKGLWPHAYNKPKQIANLGSVAFLDRSEVRSEINTQIPVITLDSLDLKECDLIKVDVEGMELDVFNGASRLISTLKPTLFYEQSSERNFSEVQALLREFGYRLFYDISNPFNTNNFFGSTENVFDGHVEINILAVHPDVGSFPTDMMEIVSDKYDPPRPSLSEGMKGVALPAIELDSSAQAEYSIRALSSVFDRFVESNRSHESSISALQSENTDLKSSLLNSYEKSTELEHKIRDIQAKLHETEAEFRQRESEFVQRQTEFDHIESGFQEQLKDHRSQIDQLSAARSEIEHRLEKEVIGLKEQTQLIEEKNTALNSLSSTLRTVSSEAVGLREVISRLAIENARLRQTVGSSIQAANLNALDAIRQRLDRPSKELIRPQSDEIGPARLRDILKVYRSTFFDPAWYKRQVLERFGNAPRTKLSLVRHYLKQGWRLGLDPHPLFCTTWYFAREADVQKTGRCPLVHFIENGLTEGRDPHPLVSVDWYRNQNPDIGDMPPVLHLLRHGLKEDRDPHPLFSSRFYRLTYDDVESYELGSFMHYVLHGGQEGRRPHPLFDPNWYRKRYGKEARYHENDLSDLVLSALDIERDPNPLFWSQWYRAQSEDLNASDMSSAMHYAAVGEYKGKWPNPIFDPTYYRRRSKIPTSDFALSHFLDHGASSGMSPHPLFSPQWVAEQAGVSLKDSFQLYLEGQLSVDPHPAFDSLHYMANSRAVYTQFYRTALSCYSSDQSLVKPSANRFFVPGYYLKNFSSAPTKGVDLFSHYIESGEDQGWKPSAFFDPKWYRDRHGDDVNELGGSLAAFSQVGVARLDDPSPMFMTQWVAHALPKPGEAIADIIATRFLDQHNEDTHPLFDSSWYRATYLDGEFDTCPITHYFEQGWKEGNAPNRFFDVPFYIELTDTRSENPLAHYVRYGIKNNLTFNPLMDPVWYAAKEEAAKDFPGGPLAHYIKIGEPADKSPTPLFDHKTYRAQLRGSDVTNLSTFRHYLEIGDEEGRQPNPDFDPTWYRERYGIDDPERTSLGHFAAYGDFAGYAPSEKKLIERLDQNRQAKKQGLHPIEEKKFVSIGAPLSRHFLLLFGRTSTFQRHADSLKKLSPPFSSIWILDAPTFASRHDFSTHCDGLRIVSPNNTKLETLFQDSRETALLSLTISVLEEIAFRSDCKRISIAPVSALIDVMQSLSRKSDKAIMRVLRTAIPNDERVLTMKPTRAAVGSLGLDQLKLLNANIRTDPSDNWHYGMFDDGKGIKQIHRELFQRYPILRARFPNPYSVEPNGGFSRWLERYLNGADESVEADPVAIPNSLFPLRARA